MDTLSADHLGIPLKVTGTLGGYRAVSGVVPNAPTPAGIALLEKHHEGVWVDSRMNIITVAPDDLVAAQQKRPGTTSDHRRVLTLGFLIPTAQASVNLQAV